MDQQGNDKDWVQELVGIMARLRGKDGCPWDQEQTHQSLKKSFVEELYEFFDSMDEGDDEGMASELGDLLLQIVFHCQIAREDNRFDLQVVARKCCEMLVRRHPHVFGDASAKSPEEVEKQWEEIKKTESRTAKRSSLLDGVPEHLPALAKAQKLQKKAAKAGFDWEDIQGPLEKIHEEVEEVKDALEKGDQAHLYEEIGDLLFAVVSLARFAKGDAEEILRQSCRKFQHRFQQMEKNVEDIGSQLQGLNLDELEGLWQEVKNSAQA